MPRRTIDPRASILLALAALAVNLSVHAATITVNSLADTDADDGDCTLREAITAANTDAASGLIAGECAAGSGDDVIAFSEAGTIQPGSALPPITTPIHIDGYTAPGAGVNDLPFTAGNNAVLTVELDGALAGNVPGLHLEGSGAAGSIIEGLMINSSANAQCCATSGIYVDEVDGSSAGRETVIRGNYIGTDKTGMLPRPKGSRGIYLDFGSTSVRVGSPSGGALDESAVNLISGGDYAGITANNVSDVVIRGNMIGTDAAGEAALTNGAQGLSLDGLTDSRIEDNLVSGNNFAGISVMADSAGLVIRGNNVGTTADGSGAIPNKGGGIYVAPGAAQGATIQDILIEENRVAHNLCADCSGGIVVAEYRNSNTVVGVRLLGNYVYGNAGVEIDLAESSSDTSYSPIWGVTENDLDDADSGQANNLQNFPVITQAVAGPLSASVNYSFNSEPNSTYTLQLFRADACDDSGHGGANELLDSDDRMTDGAGDLHGQTVVNLGNLTGFVTMTATHSVNGTSEFSECVALGGETIFEDSFESPVL